MPILHVASAPASESLIAEAPILSIPRAQTNERTAARHLVDAMQNFGIRAAFGIPGGAIGTIYDCLSHSPIDLYLTQHETSAAYAAMGRALATHCRELSVCLATSGPGMTNLVTGVAAAYAESVPLLVVTGNSSTRNRDLGALQDSHVGGIDAVRMFDSITVSSRGVSRAEELVPLFYRMAELSLRSKKPVHINVPQDVSNEVLHVVNHERLRWQENALGGGSRAFLTRFLAAERPVIFAGNGVKTSGLGPELEDVARRHALPIIVSTHARGCVPESSPHFAGTFGFASNGAGRRFLEDHRPDAILFLGTSLGEMATSGWSPLLGMPELRIQVDLDPHRFHRAYRMSAVIETDIAVVLEELGQRSSARTNVPYRPGTSMIRQRPLEKPQAADIDPRSLFQDLASLCPEDTVFFSDIGNGAAWCMHALQLRERQNLFVSLGLSSMGSGLGAALGAATKWKERPIVCICGDGAALMHGSELMTAAEYGLSVKVIVLNDGGLGMVAHGSRLVGLEHGRFRYRGRVNFESFGKALGMPSACIRNEHDLLAIQLPHLLAQPGPYLLDVWINPAVEPPISDRARVLGHAASVERR
ncbi:MAG: thiamine pyrophosphate-binding protein [Polyangiaceae bacterium]